MKYKMIMIILFFNIHYIYFQIVIDNIYIYIY